MATASPEVHPARMDCSRASQPWQPQQEVFGRGQAREDPQWNGSSYTMYEPPVHSERPQSRHESDAESDATESESESEPQERDRRSDSESEDE